MSNCICALTLPKSGMKRPNTPGLVHPPEHGLGVVAPGQQLHEQLVGARLAAHRFLDQHRIAPRHAHRLGMDLEPFLLGDLEHLDQPRRLLPEPVVARGADLPPAMR
jgi:hypothetical protein